MMHKWEFEQGRIVNHIEAKLKARDIIPGWPRGKSTTHPTVPPLTWWELHDGRLYEMVEICHPGSERHYHAQQQDMVDLFLGFGCILSETLERGSFLWRAIESANLL